MRQLCRRPVLCRSELRPLYRVQFRHVLAAGVRRLRIFVPRGLLPLHVNLHNVLELPSGAVRGRWRRGLLALRFGLLL